MPKRTRWWMKLHALVLLIGPGIFLVGYNIGTGSVTTMADYNNTPRDLRSTPARLMVLGVVALSLVVPVFGGRPVLVMIASQALGTIVTPVIILLMILLQNKEGVMGTYRPGPAQNAVLTVILAFAILTAGVGIFGIVGLL